MKLENLLRFHNPQSCNPGFQRCSGASSALSSKDVLNVMGILQSRTPLGYQAFCGKIQHGAKDIATAVSLLSIEALQSAHHYPVLRKLTDDEQKKVISVIAQYAFADWSRSAAIESKCMICNGTGFRSGKICKLCNGKGVVHASCKDCKGRGVSVDRHKSTLQGVPVYKNCKRCAGRGYSRIPAAVVYRAIAQITDKISRDVWDKNLKNLYLSLITRLDEEEMRAEKLLNCLIK